MRKTALKEKFQPRKFKAIVGLLLKLLFNE